MPSGATLLRNPQKGNVASTKGKFRLDIQGLRAFAVIVVILDHMFAWPSGGFVGVDIFFVISGFLITGHLMREWEETGHISFLKFYKGRIKRILPAATLVLAVTVGASFLLLNKSRAMSVLWDGVWASLFAGNWRFAAAGTDYFQADGPISPLQHFWSLAVEEQFYFVWPWIMLLALILVGRANSSKIRARVVAGIVLGVLSTASFVWAVLETSAVPTLAYFSTLSRAWELGIGALLAIATPLLLRIPDRSRPVIAWVGMVGMVASVFVINSASLFPAPTALLPVVSTGLVIAAGSGGEHRFLTPLTNPISSYIGNISYSLYLWHFPVIILGSTLGDPTDLKFVLSLALVMIALSIFSYHLFEDRIRKSTWLDPTADRSHGPRFSNGYKNTVLAALATCVLVLGYFAMTPPPVVVAEPQAATSKLETTAKTPSQKETKNPPLLTNLQEEISVALAATKWPTVTPSLDDAITGGQAPAEIGRCSEPASPANPAECTWGDPNASKRAVIVGDSIAVTYTSTLREALGTDKGWQISGFGTFGCFFGVVEGAPADKACDERRKSAVKEIQLTKPDIVFVANHYEGRTFQGVGQISNSERSASVKKALDPILGSAQKVVFLAAPPQDLQLAECYTPSSKPSDCIGTVIPQYQEAESSERRMATSIDAAFIESRDWFCADGKCPSFVASTPVKSDRMHMTPEYQVKIGPVVREALAGKKLL